MTAHAFHAMHINSRAAHILICQTLPARKSEVYGAVLTLACATDRDVAALLGYADLNRVRPRITEMLGEGTLIERDSRRCPVTHRMVRTVSLP